MIAGSDEVFAAGADIKAMAERTFQEALRHPAASLLAAPRRMQTPLIAAVSGFALGGGCELALLCDMIVASETAEFGQPEITLGIIPGGGGTQRLARVIGKQRAMELVLTGRRIDAAEAERLGLVNKVGAEGRVARRARWSSPSGSPGARRSRPGSPSRRCSPPTRAALTAGLEHERRLYELAMATEDRVEGMGAFLEKRKPDVQGTLACESSGVGVVGAGTMGAGIAQLACLGGLRDLPARPGSRGARARRGAGARRPRRGRRAGTLERSRGRGGGGAAACAARDARGARRAASS